MKMRLPAICRGTAGMMIIVNAVSEREREREMVGWGVDTAVDQWKKTLKLAGTWHCTTVANE